MTVMPVCCDCAHRRPGRLQMRASLSQNERVHPLEQLAVHVFAICSPIDRQRSSASPVAAAVCRHHLQEDKVAVLVATVTDDARLFEVPKLRVCALRFTETARARIVKVCRCWRTHVPAAAAPHDLSLTQIQTETERRSNLSENACFRLIAWLAAMVLASVHPWRGPQPLPPLPPLFLCSSSSSSSAPGAAAAMACN